MRNFLQTGSLCIVMLLALVSTTTLIAADGAGDVAVAQVADWEQIEGLASEFSAARQADALETSAFFGSPVSKIAREIKELTWWEFFIFIPFLVGPQIALLYIIFRYRDRKDGSKAATFMANHKLEIAWTLIPCVILVGVAFPGLDLLYRMELPPADVHADRSLTVEVTGEQFIWGYKYPDQDGLSLKSTAINFKQFTDAGLDVDGSWTLQEPLVVVNDRVVEMRLRSNDVIHAWGLQAFGAKKDCYPDRDTHLWFDPAVSDEDMAAGKNFFEGQCYELCGWGHGIMLISSVVVTQDDFDIWAELQSRRSAASSIIEDLVAGGAAVETAVQAYLEKDKSPVAQDAARYWLASTYITHADFLKNNANEAQATELLADYKKKQVLLDGAIAKVMN